MFVLTAYLVLLSSIGTLLMALFYPKYPTYYLKWGGAWCVFAVVAGIISIPVLLMLSALLYMQKFILDDPAEKASTYLATFASMPVAMVWDVPGPPGINVVLGLSLNLMIMICLFGPPLYRHFVVKKNRLIRDKYDKSFLYFLTILLLLAFIRSPTVTGGLRYVVGTLLSFGLLYFYISRYITRPKHMHLCLVGLVFGAVIISCMAAMEQLKFWYLFQEIEWAMGLAIPEHMPYLTRAGMLRAQVTTGHPIALGIYMVVGIAGVIYLWDTYPNKTLFAHFSFLSLFVLLVVGVINSGSKTGLLGLAVALTAYSYLRIKQGYTKIATKWATIFISFFIAFAPDALYLGEVGSESETILSDQASFSYRSLLLTTSLEVMLKNPFFGTPEFYSDPDMEILRQGQGIIDITNFYLGIGLELGYVGLALFLIMWVRPQLEIFTVLRRANHNFPRHLRALGAGLIAGSFSLAVMMTTVSAMGAIPFLIYTLIALSVAYLRHIRQWALQATTSASNEEHAHPPRSRRFITAPS